MDSPPFVGRQAELTALGALVDRSKRTSRPAVAVVRGEPGLGKSRLLSEFCAIRFARATRLTVIGYDIERMVPLAAATDLLLALTGVEGEGDRLAALSSANAWPNDPLRTFEATRRCLLADPPAVIVVDDLQWVDETSIALLHYLLRAAVAMNLPVTMLVATRPGDAAFTFTDAVDRLLPAPKHLLVMQLLPLDREDGFRLVSAISPTMGEVEAARFWERCGGIPFWLTIAARHDAATGLSELELLLRDLGPEPLQLISVLALLAAPTSLHVLGEVLGWTARRLSAAVATLTRRGLVTVADDTGALVHDVVREAVLTALPEQQALLTHRRLAEYLRRSANGDVPTLRRALTHQLNSGLGGVGLAVEILQARRRGLLNYTDLREFTRIADSADAAGDRSGAHRLHTEVARAATELELPDLAADEWHWLSLNAHTSAEASRAALLGSIAALHSGNRPRADALLAGCRRSDLTDPVQQTRHAAHESELRGDSTAASEEPMRRATALAARLVVSAGGVKELSSDARAAYLAAHQAAYYFELRTDHPQAMLVHADQMAQAADTAEARLRATLHRVLPLRMLTRYAEAENTARGVRFAAVREQLAELAFLSGYLQALCLHSLGRLAPAREAATDIIALADRAPIVIPSWLSTAWIHALTPEITASMDGWAGARRAFQCLTDAEPNPHFRLHIRAAAAQWAARLGGPHDARLAAQWARDGAHDARLAACTRCTAEYQLRSAEIYARIGHLDTARSLLNEWDTTHSTPAGQAILWRARVGGLVDQRRRPDYAVRCLQHARSEAAAANAKLEQVWCDLDLGSALADIDRQHSIEILHCAADTATVLQATSEQRRAQQLLRGLGVRTWRPRRPIPHDAEGLTERELSIAHMISDGATNPEIAEALFLSRKTVERHVSNVLAKTNSRNRAELAAHFTSDNRSA